MRIHRTRNYSGRRLFPLGVGLGSSVFKPTRVTGLLGWWEPTSTSRLWQDSARTTPVAADADPVGAVDALGGSNNQPLIQATAGKRPLYKTGGGRPYLLLDGTDDNLGIASFANAGSAFTFVFCAVLDAAGSFPTLAAWPDAGLELRCSSSTQQPEMVHGAVNATSASALTLGQAYVITGRATLASGDLDCRVNGSQVASTTGGASLTSPQSLNVGARTGATDPWQGKIYGIAVYNSSLSDNDTIRVERYLGSLAGISF